MTAGLGGLNPGIVGSATSMMALTSASSSPVCWAAESLSKLPSPSCQTGCCSSFSFFNWSLSLPTSLLGHCLFCPDVVDVTDTHFDAKAGLQLCLEPAGRDLRVSRADLDAPRLH